MQARTNIENSYQNTSQITPDKPSASFWQMARNNVRLLHQAPPIQPAPRHQPLPLSYNQERLWKLERLQTDSSVHNILHSFRLVGTLNIKALERSLLEIARRHEVLRTTFPAVNGQPVQQVSPEPTICLTIEDLSHLTTEAQEVEVQKHAIAQAEQAFDLGQGSLWRVTLLRLNDEEHVLLRTVHHIVFDGMSHSVFVRELGGLYSAFAKGEPSPLIDLPVQYADFAWTQRQWLQGDFLTSQLDFWQRYFDGDVAALELPTDFPRSGATSYQGAFESNVLSPALTEGLKTLSAEHGVSLFVTLFAGFNALLHQYSGQEDLIVCSPVSGRHRADTRALIGYFNNVVALRNDVSANPSFSELLGRVSQSFVEASNYQDVPLQLVAELPNLVRTPLTRAMFVLQNTATPSLELEGLNVSSVFVDREIANFDLSLSVYEKNGQLTTVLQYKTDLFKAKSIVQMLDQFKNLLESIIANSELKLTELPEVVRLISGASEYTEFALNEANYIAPRNALEQQMVQLWQNLLEMQQIGINDNFFDLGGHSLLAVKLFTEIETTFGKQLPLSTLLAAPTIAGLAKVLDSSSQTPFRSAVVELRAGKGKHPLFMIHDGDGETLLYRSLANCLDPEIPVYGIQPYACDHHPILHTRIEDMVHYYIDQIRQVQPQGPYYLSGLCAGGVLAFEIARQLQVQGQLVEMIAIIDAADVEAEHRAGYASEQRLNSFMKVFNGQTHLKAHQRVLLIANQVRKKVTNLLIYETQLRVKNLSDRAKLKAFRYCLDKKLPVPQMLRNIPVRTILVWAQQEYIPEAKFDGEVLLFRATQKSSLFDGTLIDDTPYVELYSDPLLGWSKRTTVGVQAYDISGGHSSMLQPPNVQEMADIIQTHMNKSLVKNEQKPLELQAQQVA